MSISDVVGSAVTGGFGKQATKVVGVPGDIVNQGVKSTASGVAVTKQLSGGG